MSRGQTPSRMATVGDNIAQSYKNGELRELLLLASRMITQGAETVLGISDPVELEHAEDELHSHCKELLGCLSERLRGPGGASAAKPIQLRPGSPVGIPAATTEEEMRLAELQFAIEALLDIAWKQAFKNRPQLYRYVGPKRPSDAYGVVPLFQSEYKALRTNASTPPQLIAVYEYCQSLYPPFRTPAAAVPASVVGQPMPAPPPPLFRQAQRSGSWTLTLSLLGVALLVGGLMEHYYLVPRLAQRARVALDGLYAPTDQPR